MIKAERLGVVMKSARQLHIQALEHFRGSVNSASTKPHVKDSSSKPDVMEHGNNQLNQPAKQLEDDGGSEGRTKNKIGSGNCIAKKVRHTVDDGDRENTRNNQNRKVDRVTSFLKGRNNKTLHLDFKQLIINKLLLSNKKLKKQLKKEGKDKKDVSDALQNNINSTAESLELGAIHWLNTVARIRKRVAAGQGSHSQEANSFSSFSFDHLVESPIIHSHIIFAHNDKSLKHDIAVKKSVIDSLWDKHKLESSSRQPEDFLVCEKKGGRLFESHGKAKNTTSSAYKRAAPWSLLQDESKKLKY